MPRAYTPTEKCREACRIVGQMRAQYPALVEAGKLAKEEADRRIATVNEIASDYEEAQKPHVAKTHLQVAAYALRRIKDAAPQGSPAYTIASDALREMITE